MSYNAYSERFSAAAYQVLVKHDSAKLAFVLIYSPIRGIFFSEDLIFLLKNKVNGWRKVFFRFIF